MNKVIIKPGETTRYFISPEEIRDGHAQVAVKLDAACQCGGKMIPLRSAKTPEWVCERDKWWRFWDKNHAHLVAEIQVVKPGKPGNA